MTAKRLLKGLVGIDSEAGPTEIAILADDTADPAYVAADLICQAEHDPLAAAVLVTASRALADDVEAELEKQVARDQAHRAGPDRAGRPPVGIVLVDDLDQGVEVVNAYAAEHLEIHTARRRRRAPPGSATPARSSSGPYAPVSLGDYCAGLQPRAAHRRLRLPLAAGCRCALPQVRARGRLLRARRWPRSPTTSCTLAEAEDLPGHGDAVRVRFATGADR